MSTLRVAALRARAGSGVIEVPSGNVIAQPGAIVQVVQKFYNDLTIPGTNQVYAAATNGDLNITSKVANSKFLVMISGQGYQAAGGGANLGLNRTVAGGPTVRLLGTDGAAGDSWLGTGNGATTNSWNIKREFLDSPAVAAGTVINYQTLVGKWSGGTIYLNYSGYTGGSTITIMEVVL